MNNKQQKSAGCDRENGKLMTAFCEKQDSPQDFRRYGRSRAVGRSE